MAKAEVDLNAIPEGKNVSEISPSKKNQSRRETLTAIV